MEQTAINQMEKIIGRIEQWQHRFPDCDEEGWIADGKSKLIYALNK